MTASTCGQYGRHRDETAANSTTYPSLEVFVPVICHPIARSAPTRQSYALAFERMRFRGKRIRVEVCTVMPISVFPFKWFWYGPTRIKFKRKVIKWFGTKISTLSRRIHLTRIRILYYPLCTYR